jgi:predicted transcriptional regulator
MKEFSTVYTSFDLENGQKVEVLLNDGEIEIIKEDDDTWAAIAPIQINGGEWLMACFQEEDGKWFIEKNECDGKKIEEIAEEIGIPLIAVFNHYISDICGYIGQCVNMARDEAKE